jgi:hypothetical protein
VNPLRTPIGLLLALTAILCPPPVASALVPPGNSAATQYTEAFPTAGGPKATRNTQHGGKATPGQVLGGGNAKRLKAQGAVGREVAEVAAATAPGSIAKALGGATAQREAKLAAAGKADDNTAAGAPSDPAKVARWRQPEPQGSSGLGEVIGQATGSSSGQFGLLLPLGMACVAVWSLLYLARQRKRSAA